MSVRESSGGRVGSPDYHTLFMTGFPGQIERRELRNFFWNVDGLERIFIMKEFETHRSSTSLLLLFNSAFNAQSFFVLSRSRRIEFVSQADGEVHFVTCSVADSELSSTRGTHITVIGTRRDKAAASTGLSLPIPEPSPRHAERKSSGRSRPGRYVEEEEEDVSSPHQATGPEGRAGVQTNDGSGTASPKTRNGLSKTGGESHGTKEVACGKIVRRTPGQTEGGARQMFEPISFPCETDAFGGAHEADATFSDPSPTRSFSPPSSRQMVTPGFDDRRRENRLRSFYPDMTPNAASAHKEDVSRSKDLVQGRRSKDVHRSQSPQQRSHTGARGYSPSEAGLHSSRSQQQARETTVDGKNRNTPTRKRGNASEEQNSTPPSKKKKAERVVRSWADEADEADEVDEVDEVGEIAAFAGVGGYAEISEGERSGYDQEEEGEMRNGEFMEEGNEREEFVDSSTSGRYGYFEDQENEEKDESH
eukprot:CAMPEP_0113877192 /NCGR_PEP_ID=MMETSP0780_2-20120614/5943_1 /TAXON_ID=652834 /ORGANISM="Palpitomonas bilix" /LENGTH=476 /DNA_ID=CAMNT_0000863429 /DNA_START=144 /DNA_END=1574 /DNA_ORIENTATION=+ /assembly_acc=CAM_ASM_000599